MQKPAQYSHGKHGLVTVALAALVGAAVAFGIGQQSYRPQRTNPVSVVSLDQRTNDGKGRFTLRVKTYPMENNYPRRTVEVCGSRDLYDYRYGDEIRNALEHVLVLQGYELGPPTLLQAPGSAFCYRFAASRKA